MDNLTEPSPFAGQQHPAPGKSAQVSALVREAEQDGAEIWVGDPKAGPTFPPAEWTQAAGLLLPTPDQAPEQAVGFGTVLSVHRRAAPPLGRCWVITCHGHPQPHPSDPYHRLPGHYPSAGDADRAIRARLDLLHAEAQFLGFDGGPDVQVSPVFARCQLSGTCHVLACASCGQPLGFSEHGDHYSTRAAVEADAIDSGWSTCDQERWNCTDCSNRDGDRHCDGQLQLTSTRGGFGARTPGRSACRPPQKEILELRILDTTPE